MKKYHYVKTDLTPNEFDELIVSEDDPLESISARLLIWPNGGDMDVEENQLFQVHYRKSQGEWVKLILSYTYLPDHIVAYKEELVTSFVSNKYPPGFHMK